MQDIFCSIERLRIAFAVIARSVSLKNSAESQSGCDPRLLKSRHLVYPAEQFPNILVRNSMISKLSISVFVQSRHEIPGKLLEIQVYWQGIIRLSLMGLMIIYDYQLK